MFFIERDTIIQSFHRGKGAWFWSARLSESLDSDNHRLLQPLSASVYGDSLHGVYRRMDTTSDNFIGVDNWLYSLDSEFSDYKVKIFVFVSNFIPNSGDYVCTSVIRVLSFKAFEPVFLTGLFVIHV
ncbi:unnamed protein product [Cochlearia groenlandica]